MMRIVCLLLVVSAAAFGQAVSGTIFGSVRDQSEAAVPGAMVTVRNANTNYTRSAAADADGGFRFPLLPLGSYTLSVEAPGFSQSVREGLTLQVDQQVRVDVVLQVGAVSEKVLVTAEAPLINAVNAETSEVIDRQRVEQLPLNGRNFVQLLQLTAGTTPGATGDTQNNLVINQFRGSTAFTANGMPTRYNNFILDGIDNNENAWNSGGIVLMPVIDAIQEFKVSTGNFSSEFGRAAGGVVNVQTRSGTNEFHGNLFEFLRNDKLDANDFFNNANNRGRPSFRQNQFGGTFGGPVVRDKLFFFTDYQGTRQRRELTFLASVAPANARGGDFSNPLFPQIYDPATTRPAPSGSGSIRDPFPGRQIPASRFDPLTRNFLDVMPRPNTNLTGIALNLINNPKWERNGNQGDIRMDYNLGAKGALFGRYSMDRSDQIFPNDLTTPENPFGGGGRGNNLDVTAQNLSLNGTWVTTPSLVLEGRAGVSRFNFKGLPLGFGVTGADKVQVPGMISDTARSSTNLAITGLTAFGPTTGVPNFSVQTTFQYALNATLTRGRHSFKSGVDVKRFRRNNFLISAQPTGAFSFSPNFTSQTGVSGGGVGLASFLLGLPNQINRGFVSGGVGRRNTELGVYWQDEFKATPELTINFGVRYDLFTPWYEIHDRMSSIDLTTGKVVLAGEGNLFGRSLRRTDRNNIAPRFGLAWRAPGASRLVVRAGYGLSYIEEFGGNGSNPIQNPPNAFTQNLQFSTIQLPPTRFRDGIPAPVPLDLNNPSSQYRFIAHDAVSAYAQQWDLSLQREFGANWMVDASYVGTKGTHILQLLDPNQAVPGPGAINPRRPLFALAPNLTTNVGDSTGNSIYHSLQLKLQKRFSHGFYFLTAYTLSKNISDGDSNFSNGTPGVTKLDSPQDARNRRAERSLSDTDQPQRLVTSYGWELPFLKGRRLLGGWQLSGIVTFSSGNPFDILFTPTTLNTGSSQRPNRIADGRITAWTKDRYFDTAAFTAPAAFTFGNSGRNVLRGPGVHTWDFSVIKDTRLSERYNVQWRTDFFNAFNTTQFNPPGNTIGTPQAGRINSTRFSTNRQIQFVMKLFF